MSTDESLSATHAVRGVCICFRAQRAARFLARRFDAALRPLGLTSGQFSLMNALNQGAPTDTTDLATLLGADRTTLTAALKPLVRRALVTAQIDPADRRGRRFALTQDGFALLNEAIPAWRRCHDQLEGALGHAAADRLRNDLDELARSSTPSDGVEPLRALVP